MADDTEGPDSGAEASTAGVDPAAAALALGGASREDADAFLKDQRKLIAKQGRLVDLQSEYLANKDRYELSHLRWRRFTEQMKGALQLMTAVVGIAIAGFGGIMIWNAAHDDSLIIEAFSVPPDYGARGLTGQVVAGELLRNLSLFQTRSSSVRAASSYTNNWGDDIKIEIPETGVSIGEFSRLLHEWLGHQTHITGAVYRTSTGVAVTARVGSDTVPTITGADSEIDPILRKVSEAIYSKTQPYRFAQYVYGANGFKEGEIAQKSLIANGSAKDRFWAYNGLITMYAAQLDFERADKAARSAIALRPESALPYFNLGRSELVARHDETALVASEAASRHQRDPDIDEQTWASVRPWIECLAASLHGDFGRAIELCRQAEFSPDVANNRLQARLLQMPAFAAVHDAAALHDAYADLPPTSDPPSLAARAGYEALNEVSLGHWSLLLDKRALFQRNLTKLPYGFFFNLRSFQPAVAYALALSGDLSGAHAEIDKTPADCSVCLRMRGRIDALQKNWNGADYWFARAARDAPSTPFAFMDWGRMLLDKGDTDAAIEKFRLANQKSQHFADPLEGWGEALMARNRSDLALAKFTQAEKYAPNWGRLHLKWGEALVYAGKPQDAKAQFARAAGLDLTPAEKAELAGVAHG